MTKAVSSGVTSGDECAGALASRLVKAAEISWQKTRFEGIDVKTLLVDKASGLVTALVRMAPGAVLPDHQHVQIEQTYMLEGHLVDKEGPDEGIEARAGDFIWRPAGSRHVAWAPRGGLMLAMFQIPNKFFESDGRVTDMSGANWQDAWGSAEAAHIRGRS